MSMKPKYKTLAELKSAYDSGKLDRKKTQLYIDNDQTSVRGPRGASLFEGGMPTDLLGEALTLLGIPREYV